MVLIVERHGQEFQDAGLIRPELNRYTQSWRLLPRTF
jgi:hypothetical protein